MPKRKIGLTVLPSSQFFTVLAAALKQGKDSLDIGMKKAPSNCLLAFHLKSRSSDATFSANEWRNRELRNAIGSAAMLRANFAQKRRGQQIPTLTTPAGENPEGSFFQSLLVKRNHWDRRERIAAGVSKAPQNVTGALDSITKQSRSVRTGQGKK